MHDGRLVSQARPTSAREGKGLVSCVYKPCPATQYSAVQSHCSIFSHDTLHHCMSSNSRLENGERELGHLFCYCRNCKNTLTILLRERAYSATGNARVHYLKFEIWLCHPTNCSCGTLLVYAVHQTLPFSCRSGSGCETNGNFKYVSADGPVLPPFNVFKESVD